MAYKVFRRDRFPLTPRPCPLQASLNAHLREQTLRLRKGEDIIASPMMTGLPCAAVRPSAAPSKYKERPRERIFRQLAFAKRGKPIDAVTEVYRLAGEEYPDLRDELNH
jgi:hypothetical protein